MKYQFTIRYTIVLAAILFLCACKEQRKLPVYGLRDTKTVKNSDGTRSVDTVYQTIPAFKLLNQDSTYITNDNFKGKIYVADFFFTSCTSICPIMHRNMKNIFDKFRDNPEVMFLSHTIDFKYDTPSVLKKYAQKLGVDGPKWQFAYGLKDTVYGLATKSYLVSVEQDGTDKQGYVHQGYLVLIDKDRRIRGAYDGTNADQVAQLEKDIPVLLEEKQ
ncbi:SCO family protein [Pedobacter hartonius]|uniref:Protein SCO1/2 n=1 Tax=Pedobacter hartonius TaxID=425514 RepID=A0A1H4D7Z0_9SPHI|nr:SCO family protein [Pedobacter hartonius]SEA68580.1 protein SCO1/2 [Pedobacter hartonius]